MSTKIDLIRHLDEINKSIEELTLCFVEGYGGVTIHQTLEEIKVVNNDIAGHLKRIADAMEKQVANQILINTKLLGNLHDTH